MSTPAYKHYLPYVVLLLIVILTTLLFRSHFLFSWDSGQFALGTTYYDLTSHQPHAPGYPLFIATGALIDVVVHDINLSFILINLLATILAATLLFACIRYLGYTQRTALAASLLVLLHPFVWHFRTVALTYTFEVLAPIAAIFWIVRSYRFKEDWALLMNAGTMALLIGFRPSVVLIALPLLCMHWFIVQRKARFGIWALVIFIATCLVWFIPFMTMAGGFDRLMSAIRTQYAPLPRTIVNVSMLHFYMKSLLVTAGLLVPLFLWKRRPVNAHKAFTTMLVGIVIYLVIIYTGTHFGSVGYILPLVPLLVLIALPRIDALVSVAYGQSIVGALIVISMVAFIVPIPWVNSTALTRLNYLTVLEHDGRIRDYLDLIEQYDPRETILISARGHYFDEQGTVTSYKYDDSRVLEWYLPAYTMYDVPGTPGRYYEIKRYRYDEKHSSTIELVEWPKNVIILAEYLHPIVRPAELTLRSRCERHCMNNYYVADLRLIDSFMYNGLRFTRLKPLT